MENPDLAAAPGYPMGHAKLISLVCIGTLFFIITLYLTANMIYLVGKNIKNEPASISQALQIVINKFFTVICAQILILLIIIALALMCFLIGKLTIAAAGFLILTLLIVILMVRFNFFIPLILFDNTAIAQSIVQSYKLTISYWWRTFALTVVAALANVPFIMAQHFVPQNISILLQVIDIIIVYPFTYNILLLQFYDLKARHSLSFPHVR